MKILAQIITAAIGLEGLALFLFPSLGLKVTRKFNSFKIITRRLMGFLCIVAGGTFFYLTEQTVTGPLVHWIVAVTGIYAALWGLAIAVAPGYIGRFIKWLYREKAVNIVMGFIFLVIGAVFFLKI
ncbi:MAG: hypothetical protein ACQEQC_03370 [Elusimicrobiota bacterium]